jgi:hypothetical protein
MLNTKNNHKSPHKYPYQLKNGNFSLRELMQKQDKVKAKLWQNRGNFDSKETYFQSGVDTSGEIPRRS